VNKSVVVDLCYFPAIVTCPQLNVSNSVLNTTDSNFTTAVQVVCDVGYAIDPLNLFNNSINTVCTSSGNWSTFPILCQRKSHRSFFQKQQLNSTTELSAGCSAVSSSDKSLYVEGIVSLQDLSALLTIVETAMS
jgi:hypothetical protein